jgi:group I intron endonuclease
MVWSVYKITCRVNGKVYIGQTRSAVKERWRQHCELGGSCVRLENAIRKYGKDVFDVEVLASCLSLDDADFVETRLIAEYDSSNRHIGFNILSGGRGRHIKYCKNGHDLDIVGRRQSACKVCHTQAMRRWYEGTMSDPERAERRRRENTAAARRKAARDKAAKRARKLQPVIAGMLRRICEAHVVV